jgi:Flp pilus assembly protein TadG
LAEFSLVLPVLMLAILGLIEMGRLIYIYSAVTTASREGARYGFSLGDNDLGLARYQDCAGIRNAAKAPTSIAGIEDSDIEIYYDSGPGTAKISSCPLESPETGNRIVVTVTATFQPIVPLVNLPSIDISSTTKRTILVAVDALY